MVDIIVERFQYQCDAFRFHNVATIPEVINGICSLIIPVQLHIVPSQDNKGQLVAGSLRGLNTLLHVLRKCISHLLAVKNKIGFT